ncbi:DNA-binding transcriptional regulator Fis [bacterium]|nr:DNA-binding transcriptional regulator Fis [bacterium]
MSPSKASKLRPLHEQVADSLGHYLGQLNGSSPCDLYQMVMDQVEAPLLNAVMEHTGGNQSRASEILGINRGTLRKKLKAHGIAAP